MRSKAKPATAAQSDRMGKIKRLGCLCCRRLNRYTFAEADHQVSAGKRLGHDATVGLCCWHHRAVPLQGMTHGMCREILGPSKAEGTKPFRARWGSDEELLAEQNRLLESFSDCED